MRSDLKSQFTHIKEEYEGEFIKIRITGDEKDLEKIKQQISQMNSKDIPKIKLDIDRANFDKHLKDLENSAGKSSKQIADTFKRNIATGFEPLSIGDLIKKQFGNSKRYSGTAAKETIAAMAQPLSTPLPDDASYMDIVRRAEAYEQLAAAIKDVQQNHPKDFKKLGIDQNEVQASIDQFYQQIGARISNEANRTDFISQIQASFVTLSQNLATMMQSIIDDVKAKIGGGTGTGTGSGTGSGDGSGTGSGTGGGTGAGSVEIPGGFQSDEINELDNQIDKLAQDIENAKQRLQELQNTGKDAKAYDIRQMMNGLYKEIDTILQDPNTDPDEADRKAEELKKRMLDLYATYQKVGGSDGDLNETMWEEMYDWIDEYGDGKAIKGLKVVDEAAIANQQSLIQGLISTLDALKAKREELLKQPQPSSTQQTGQTGSSPSSSGDQSGTQQTGETTKIPVEPDATNFIEKIQEQISGQAVDVEVNPIANDLKEKIESQIPEIDIKLGNISGGTVKGSDAYNIIESWTKNNRKDIFQSKPEQGMVMNDSTGYASEIANSTVAGLSTALINQAIQNAEETVNSVVHSHPNESTAAFSFDDILAAINQKIEGVVHQYVVSINDVAALDVSSFSPVELKQISDILKSKMVTVEGSNLPVWDEEQVFSEVINNSIQEYINKILVSLQNQMLSDGQNINIVQDLIARVNESLSKVPLSTMNNWDNFYDIIQQHIDEAAKSMDIPQFDASSIDDHIQSAMAHAIQVFAENALMSAVKQVRPDINIGDVYKKTSLDNYFRGESLLPGGKATTTVSTEPTSSEHTVKVKTDVNFDDVPSKLQAAIDSGSPYKVTVSTDASSMKEIIQGGIDAGSPYQLTSIQLGPDMQIGEQIQQNIESFDYLVKPDLDPSSDLAGKVRQALASGEPYKVILEADTGKNGSGGKTGESPISSGNALGDQVAESMDRAANSAENASKKIEEANQRMNSYRDAWQRESISRTLSGNYEGYGEGYSNRTTLSQLKNAHEAYDTAVANEWNWEDQYQWGIKFVNLFEQYRDNGGTQKSLAAHVELYERLKPLAEGYAAELQKVLNFTPGSTTDQTQKPTQPSQQTQQSQQGTPRQPNTAAYRQEQEEVSHVVEAEAAAFDRLKEKLTSEIPAAVDTKTQAFRSEQVEVENLIDLEISKLSELSTALQNVFKNNGSNPDFGQLKELFETIKTLGEGEIKLPNFDQLFESVGKLAQVFEQLKGVQPGQDFADTLNSLKVTKTNIDNLVNLAAAIEMLGEAFKKLNTDSMSNEGLSSIQTLLDQADALKDLATILTSDQEKIKKAMDATSGSGGGNKQSELKELRDYNKAVIDYYNAQQRLQTGKTETKSRDELISAKAFDVMTAYEEKMAELQKKGVQLSDEQTQALEKRKQKQEELNKLVEDYNRTRSEKQSKRIKDEVDKEMKALGNQIDNAARNTQGKNDAYKQQIGDMKDQYADLEKFIQGIDWNGKSEQEVNTLNQQLQEVITRINKIKDGLALASNSGDFKSANANMVSRLNSQMAAWMDKNTAASSYFPAIKQLQEQLKSVGSSEQFNGIVQGFERIKAEAIQAGLAGKSFADTLKGSFGNLARYLMSFASFYRIIGTIKQAVSVVRELDTALTEMRKVSDESLTSLKNYQKETFNMANQVGTTSAQIQRSTADWLRLGRSFDNAKEMATLSTKLLNVSEFENIQDATDSLVSATQAFTEVQAPAIVDKLNLIGNNFAISTDDLAKGLQNAGAVLKTQGNDLDQTLALLTAGNLIGQDISKASAGVRTIALRIAGTEEAKDEIKDLGEDVDDFVVRTKSKTDSIIKNYTAVASNNYQGVSVLDDNGNLRDTYDILLDISEIYKEIQEEDKKVGTNRAQALVETLAGKNRSNIVASILQNGDILKQVRESSANDYFGSSDQELSKYLDSIDGKMAKLKNKLQELAYYTINSDGFKILLDLVNGLITAVNTLAKSLGGLNLAIGGVAGFFLKKKGFAVLDYDKQTRQWTNIFQKIGGRSGKTFSMAYTDEVKEQFSKFDPNDTLKSAIEVNGNVEGQPKELQNYYNQLSETQKQTMLVSQAQAEMQKRSTLLGNALGTASSFGKQFVSVLSSMAIATIVSAGISLLIKTIYNLITYEQRMIDKGKEAQNVIKGINDSYNSKKTFVDDNLSRYSELRKGVSVTEDDGVQNKSLSNEEFSEFLSLNKEMQEMFPSLVTGFDAQGNAMLDLSADADDASKSMQTLLEQERQMADFKVGEQLGDAVKGFAIRYKQLSDDIDEQDQTIEAAQSIQDIINGKTQEGIDLSKFGFDDYGNLHYEFDVNDEAAKGVAHMIADAYNAAAGDLGGIINDDSEITGVLSGGLSYFDESQLADFKDNFLSKIAEMKLGDVPEAVLDAMSIKNIDLAEQKADWNALVPSILSQLNFYEDYQKLGDSKIGEQLQQIIADDVSNLDLDHLEEIYGKGAWTKFQDNTRGFIRENFLDPITKTLIEDGKISDEKVNLLDQLINFDGSDLTNEEYRSQINDIVNQFSKDAEVREDIKVLLGFKYYDEDGNTHWDITKQRDKLYEALGGFVGDDATTGKKTHHVRTGMNISWDNFKKLDQSELSAISYAESNMGVDLETIDEWDKLKEVIAEAKEQMEEVSEITSDGTLADIFKDETYQEQAEQYKKQLTTINDALEKYKTNTMLTNDEQAQLMEELQISDISPENLQNMGAETISGWVDQLHKLADEIGLTKDEMQGLEEYIKNIYLSYDQLDIANDQATGINYISNRIASKSGSIPTRVVSEKTSNIYNQLSSEFGQVDNEIVYYLSLNPESATWTAEQWISHYKDTKIDFQLTANDKDLQRVNKLVENNQKDIAQAEANNSLKEANGGVLNPEDYNVIVGKQQDSANALRNRATGLYEQWQKYNLENPQYDASYSQKLWDDYVVADTEAAKAEADLAEKQKQQRESSVNEINKRIEDAQASASVFQANIKKADANGRHASDETYSILSGYLKKQADDQRELYNEYKGLVTTNPEFATYWNQKASDALNASVDLDEESYNTRIAPITNYIDDLINKGVDGHEALSDLQREATDLENDLNEADSKHLKISDKLYKNLISNGDKQIRNLEEQRKKQRELQSEFEHGTSDWQKYQQEIDNINSSIDSMRQNQMGWTETMNSLVSTNAQQLASTISSAFSEMSSGTGLTIDTMNELERQFSDLAGHDVSDIFYQSADGMKFNADAAEALVDAEYELQSTNLSKTLTEQKDIIKQCGDAQDETTQKTIAAANERIVATQREMAMLQAWYDQQKEAFSGLQKFQTAQSTANEGADYETMQGYLKTQQENRTKGLTGTDEFRAYTEYFDRWGLDTVAAWDRNKEKVQRYLTEDFSGMRHFFDDLVTNGLAEKNGDAYNLDIENVKDAAEQMGMTVEWFMDMLGRAEDYGLRNDWIESEIDGREKIQEAIHQQIEAQKELTKAQQEGAPEEVIQDAQNVYEDRTAHLNNLRDEVETITSRPTEMTKDEFLTNVATFKAIRNDWKHAKTDEEREAYEQELNRLAEETGLEVDLKFKIDKDSYNEQLEKYGVMTNDQIPQASDLGIGIERAPEYEQLSQSLYDLNQNADSDIQAAINTLGNYTAEQLKSLDLISGGYDDTFEGSIEAEKAMDALNQALGNTGENADLLAYALEALGLTQQKVTEETTTEVRKPKKIEPEEKLDLPTNLIDLAFNNVKEKVTEKGQGLFETAKTWAQEANTKIQERAVAQREIDQKPTVDSINNMADTVGNAIESGLENLGTTFESVGESIVGAIEVITNPDSTNGKTTKTSQSQIQKPGISAAQTQQNKLANDENASFSSGNTGVTVTATVVPEDTSQLQGLEATANATVENASVQDGVKVEVEGTANVTEAENNIVKPMQIQATANANVEVADGGMKQSVSVDTNQVSEASSAVSDLSSQVSNIPEGKAHVDAETSSAMSALQSVEDKLYEVGNTPSNPSVNITVNGKTELDSVKNTIDNLKDKTITITTKHVSTGSSGSGSGLGGINNEGFAFAGGTEKDRVIPTTHAGETLVGEEGYEIHVDRDGRQWNIVGENGPEFRTDIAPGDIVFNHEQSKKLLKNGYTTSRGKALASGNVEWHGPAYADGDGKNDAPVVKASFAPTQPYVAPKTLTKTISEGTSSIKDQTKSSDDNTKAVQDNTSKLDKFQQWLDSLKDWIEVRIARLTYKMEMAITKSENLGGKGNKTETVNGVKKKRTQNYADRNDYINEAMSINDQLRKDNKSGAKEYGKYAAKVARKAQKAGLITKAERKDLVPKIQDGAISIEDFSRAISKKKNKNGSDSKKTENTIKTFIDAYTEWYEKMLDCKKAQEECIAKQKELQQTKLDNITEQFEGLIEVATSYQNVSDSMIHMLTAQGRTAVNDEKFQKQYDNQITEEQNISSYLKMELDAYDAELVNAKKVFGENSNEYRAAMAQRNEIEQSYNESIAKIAELRKAKEEMVFKSISNTIERIKGISSLISARMSLSQKRGNKNNEYDKDSEDPNRYIKMNEGLMARNNDMILMWNKQREEAARWIGKNKHLEGSEEYQDYYNRYIEAEEEILGLMENQEDIKKNIRDYRWKSFNDLQQEVKNTITEIDNLRSTMNEAEFFDAEFGINITDKGYANIALLRDGMIEAEKQVADYQKALEKLEEDYDNGNISADEYRQGVEEYSSAIKEGSDDIRQYEDALVSMYKTQIQNENDLLQKNITARKNALTAKKACF